MGHGFPNMAEIIPEGRHGAARVEHFEVSREASSFSGLRGGREFVAPGRYARLTVNGTLWMSDTRWERITNSEAAHVARGSVLVAGLGLGMVLTGILAKPGVTAVTVIEKSEDVLALISPHFSDPRVTFVRADIWEWRPEDGAQYDVIYFDIWNEQSTETLQEMTRLHRRFRRHLHAGGWMDSWQRDYLRAQRRREQKEDRRRNFWR